MQYITNTFHENPDCFAGTCISSESLRWSRISTFAHEKPISTCQNIMRSTIRTTAVTLLIPVLLYPAQGVTLSESYTGFQTKIC